VKNRTYDCIVIGGGHAGIESALAASRMGCATLMVTLSVENIGRMSCNPAIGGVGKGQLVREVDALGGEMGLAADCTGLQFRQINASKGQAVRSSRCQSDKIRYSKYMQDVILSQKKLDVLEDMAGEILVKNGKAVGIKTESGKKIKAKTVVIAAGTFLKGRIHIGKKITPAGRYGEPPSVTLTDNLEALGFKLLFFKTGTPPRIDGSTIDFSKMQQQDSDDLPVPFSFRTSEIPGDQRLLPCHITYTNEKVHDIIRANLHLSPMYSGQINSTGVRYCPSIEDKLKKFSDKERHHVFLEPEGLDTDVYYPNGISTGLPANVQEKMVHAIKGLEKVKILRHGYSIEHAAICPTQLTPSLETKKIQGLFLAGQLNGTTGYEEAAAQGMMAGINAALKVKNKKPFILGRDEAYTGVLIDDLTTKGTNEPYRMFTSRVEYRLIVREDNTDKRLVKYGHKFGLISNKEYRKIQKKYELIEKEIKHLRSTRVHPGSSLDKELRRLKLAPIRQSALLSDILKRPEVTYRLIATHDGKLKDCPQEIIDQVEYEIKYEGFIAKQSKIVERFKNIEKIKVPKGIEWDNVNGLSFEIREKLKLFSPTTLGQANRISGVTPAAIAILIVYIRKWNYEKKKIKAKTR